MARFNVTNIEGELPEHVKVFTAEDWQHAERLGTQVLESQRNKGLEDGDAPSQPVSCAWLCSANNTFCNPDAPNPCIGAGRCRYVCW